MLVFIFSIADTKWCKDCIPALEALEQINNEASNFGVSVVRNSEKATAKKHGVTTFPTLVYFRNQQPATFDGNQNFVRISLYYNELLLFR